jgi:hypothetical protein
MPRTTFATVHHLYSRPGDLLPACGAVPGPDGCDWNTGLLVDGLLALASEEIACCSLCVDLARSLV